MSTVLNAGWTLVWSWMPPPLPRLCGIAMCHRDTKCLTGKNPWDCFDTCFPKHISESINIHRTLIRVLQKLDQTGVKQKQKQNKNTRIRNEHRECYYWPYSIRRIVWHYYKQLYTHKLNNLENLDQFLETHKLPKWLKNKLFLLEKKKIWGHH